MLMEHHGAGPYREHLSQHDLNQVETAKHPHTLGCYVTLHIHGNEDLTQQKANVDLDEIAHLFVQARDILLLLPVDQQYDTIDNELCALQTNSSTVVAFLVLDAVRRVRVNVRLAGVLSCMVADILHDDL